MSSILVAEIGEYLWVRVNDKGSFQNAADLKSFAMQMVGLGRGKFIVDLCECPMMDSTFMGTLAGIAVRMRDLTPPGTLTVIHANERNRQLLENLGLTRLFELESDDTRFAAELKEVGRLLEATKAVELPASERGREVLEAHETLSEVSEENRERFKDVVEFLRSDASRME